MSYEKFDGSIDTNTMCVWGAQLLSVACWSSHHSYSGGFGDR